MRLVHEKLDFFDYYLNFLTKLKIPILILLSFVLFLYSFSFYSNIFKDNYQKSEYYQYWFGPAAKLACGDGFVNYDLTAKESQKLHNFIYTFLHEDKPLLENLSCKDVKVAPSAPLLVAHNGSKYLIYSLGLVWKYKGISWKSAYVLAATFGAASIFAIYLLFSLVMPFWCAWLLTLIYMKVSVLSEFIIHIRDFSKVPFFLFFIYFLIKLIIKLSERAQLKTLLKYGFLLGLILGISIGFRIDLKIMILPVVVISLSPLFWYKNKKLASTFFLLSSFFSSYLIVASPMLSIDRNTHASYHVISLGFSDIFNKHLGLNNESYSKATHYNDALIEAQFASYNKRISNIEDYTFKGLPYEVVGRKVFMEWVRLFPYDFYARMIASAKKILLFPFERQENYIKISTSKYIMYFCLLVDFFLLLLLPFYTGASTVFLVIFLLTFPSLQFYIRHFFHLEPLVGILFFGPLISLVFRLVSFKNITINEINFKLIGRNFLFYLSIFLVIWMSGFFFKRIQNQQVRSYARNLLAREKNNVNYKIETRENSIRYFVDTSIIKSKYPPTDLDYYVIELDLPNCSVENLDLNFDWISDNTFTNYSFKKNKIKKLMNAQKAYAIFPSHHIFTSRFQALVTENNNNPKCVESVKVIESLEGLKITPYFFIFDDIEKTDFTLHSI